MGVVGKIAAAVGAFVLAIAGVGAYLYFTDYAAEGVVTQKSPATADPKWIVLTTKVVTYDVKQEVSTEQWALLQVGNFVEYHIQTGRTLVYENEGGDLLYDSG